MDDLLQFLLPFILVLIGILTLQYYKQRWPVANFPPGPTGVPIIGTLLSITSDKHLHRTASKLSQRYGNVYSLMLDTPVVVVNGFEAINEALQSNKGLDFASRREPRYMVQLINPKKLGLFSADFSVTWQHQKRFALSTLRGFGFGKSSFEGKFTERVQTLLRNLKDLADVPQDLSTLLTDTIASSMSNTILGCQYEDDEEFQLFIHRMLKGSLKLGTIQMLLINFVPFSRPFLKRTAQEFQAEWSIQSSILTSRVAEHQKTFRSEEEPRDFVDCYLTKMAEEPDIFNLEELTIVLLDLFLGSTDTTSNTLRFALLYMVVNTDVQEKVHQELMEIVGTSRLPCMEDRDKTHYTVATIFEILRLSCVASTFPRCATTDTTLVGYSIPKGTNVLINIMGLSRDPKLWPDPERFDPTRHLNDKGEVVKSPYLLNFGAGRRVCMGESLAKMELFLCFSSMMHQFKFELPPGAETPSLEPVPGFNLAPVPYQVILKAYDHSS
ncbi:cytochrome P450 2D15-like [Amphiura filiformis]|uniref:cytochrome P450 2D15-like n=1 Tax=Amphiura filiformis TaxID=82378 RepID=UPI003B21350F